MNPPTRSQRAGATGQPAWPQPPQRADAPRRARWLALTLTLFDLGLAGLHWASRDLGAAQGSPLRGLFSMGGEWKLPALFATAQLLLAAALAAGCWRQRQQGIWLLAAAVCGWMGADELLSLHEAVGHALRDSGWLAIGAHGTVALGPLQVYAWTLVFGPLALTVGALLLRGFLRVLPPGDVALLALGAVVFVAGAIGFETRQSHGLAAGRHARASDVTALNVMAEETLELLGVTLVVYVLAKCHAQARPAAVVRPVRADAAIKKISYQDPPPAVGERRTPLPHPTNP